MKILLSLPTLGLLLTLGQHITQPLVVDGIQIKMKSASTPWQAQTKVKIQLNKAEMTQERMILVCLGICWLPMMFLCPATMFSRISIHLKYLKLLCFQESTPSCLMASPTLKKLVQVMFAGPVHWTKKLTETELNPTAKDQTTGCSCTNSEIFWLPVVRFLEN